MGYVEKKKGDAMTPWHQMLFEEFREKEIAKLRTIEKYAYDARSNSVPLHREVRDGFSHGGRLDWAAVNAYVRSNGAEILLDRLESFALQMGKTLNRVSSVVVTSDKWLASLADAHEIDLRKIRNELDDLFQGLNYFGVIEPALYPRRHHPGAEKKGVVSWHGHLLTWDTERETLWRRLGNYNSRTVGPLYGVPPANLRERSWKSAAVPLLYMLKTPAKSYSTRRIVEHIDAGTGEVIAEHDHQTPQKLRPGEHVHMRNVLREFKLDDLLVAGGTVKPLLNPLRERLFKDRELYYSKQAIRICSWDDRLASRKKWPRSLDAVSSRSP